MNAFTLAGVVPIAGAQYNITTVAAASIAVPTSAQRAPVTQGAPAAAEFKVGLSIFPILEMWLTVEVAPIRITTDGTTPTATVGSGHVIGVTSIPLVIVGERAIRAIRYINSTAANGAIISYAFFFQEAA